MKKEIKKRKRMACLMLCAIAGLSIISCDKPVYSATSKFYWSDDAGATYVSGTKEYEVGENVYMQLIIKVTSTTSEPKKIGVSLEIPYIKDVVSKYFDGQVITPEVDELNHISTYNFEIIASDKSTAEPFVFQFIPTKATDIKLKLTFDDNVDPIYDKQNTVVFINPKPAEK